MIYKSLFLIGLIGASATLNFAAHAVDKSHKTHSHSHTEFIKPGAAIAMTHDYDGQTQSGHIEQFTATLEHIYENGFLTLTLNASDGLDLISDSNAQTVSATPGSTISVPIQISSIQNGQHYIGLDIVYEDFAGAQSRRALSIPITIGDKADNKPNVKSEPLDSISSKGLVIMTAHEEIK